MATDLMLFILLFATCVRIVQAVHHRELSRLLERILEGDGESAFRVVKLWYN